MLGGAQTLLAGVTALVAGTVYEAFGRTAAYLVAAAMMLALVGSGWIIAGSARRLKGGPADAPLEATAIADPVLP